MAPETSVLDALTEPLLAQDNDIDDDHHHHHHQQQLQQQQQNDQHGARRKTSQTLAIPVASCEVDDNNVNGDGDGDGDGGCDSNRTSDSNSNDDNNEFCVRHEISQMLSLGFPLAVSFFCRMGMASTDSAFVGHITDGHNSPEVYLAAAVLSDMVLNICITPPLAFNQVLNGLVSQAVGSNNPRIAGIWLQQSMFWLSIAMLPCLSALFFVEPILLALGFPSDICAVAGTYAKYNVVWPIPNGLYQCMRFYFQARGLPQPAMYNNILFLFVNATLNWVFVFGGPIPGWNGLGFIGAAVSLSISRTMQGICYYLYMFVYKRHHEAAWPEGGWTFSHHTKERTAEFMKQSIPNIGTLLFQSCASQAQTILVGRLGELPIAASSALSTVTIPWSGTLSATCCTISGVRVGYHLGRGNANAAKRSSWLVMYFITAINAIMAVVFLVPFLTDRILTIATDDENVVTLAKTLIPAMLVGTYLNSLVSNGTSGIFSGQGRPLIATVLSFGLELPLSIGGVAIYILYFHGNLIGVYWWGAIAAGIEVVIVLYLILKSDWGRCADEAQERQETSTSRSRSRSRGRNDDDDDVDYADLEDGETSAATTDLASSSSSEVDNENEDESDYEGDENEDELAEVENGTISATTSSKSKAAFQILLTDRAQDDLDGATVDEPITAKMVKAISEEITMKTATTTAMPTTTSQCEDAVNSGKESSSNESNKPDSMTINEVSNDSVKKEALATEQTKEKKATKDDAINNTPNRSTSNNDGVTNADLSILPSGTGVSNESTESTTTTTTTRSDNSGSRTKNKGNKKKRRGRK